MAKYRTCLLCETSYKYCSGCSQDKKQPGWMAQFHEENCKNIFQICTNFNMKFLTKKEAQEALLKCDLSNKLKFKDYVQKDLENIFAEDEKPIEKKLVENKPAPTITPKTVKAPAIKTEKAAKAPVAPKAAKTPVVEKTEPVHEVVNKTAEK